MAEMSIQGQEFKEPTQGLFFWLDSNILMKKLFQCFVFIHLFQEKFLFSFWSNERFRCISSLNHRSIFGFSVIDDEQIFLSSFEFEVRVDQAFTFNQTTSVSDRFNFLYFWLCFRASAPLIPRESGKNPPVDHNLTELVPFIEPQSQSTPEHNLQVFEESDQAVDLDGIKHSFNRSMETVVNVSALLGSSGLSAPQDNSVSRLFNESENEQDVAQGTN